jgi:predicted PurR-regulated permease PerM
LILGLLLWVLAPVLTPFVIGAVMAYALEPAVTWLVRKRVPRLLAVIVVEIVVLLIMVSIVFLVVPIISNQVPLLREQVPLMLDRLNTTVPPWLAQWGIQISVDTSSTKALLLKFLNANLEEWVRTAVSSARLGGSILMTVIGTLFLVPLVLFYLLMDWPQLVKRINDLVPPRLLKQSHEIFLEVDDILGQYLRGQLLVMLTMACYYSVGLALFGFQLALPVGVFTGAAMCIPYLGFGVGLFLALFAGWQALWLGAVMCILALIGHRPMCKLFHGVHLKATPW